MAASSWCSGRSPPRCSWSGCGRHRSLGSWNPPSIIWSARRSPPSCEAHREPMPDTLSSWPSLAPVTPEICLVVAVCLILLFDVFAGERRTGLTATLTLFALAASAALTVAYGHVAERTVLLHGMYVADELAWVLKLAGFLVVAVALLYSRSYLENRHIMRGEYYVLSLTVLLGIFVLVSANNLVTVYLGVELLALSVYALAPRPARRCPEAR